MKKSIFDVKDELSWRSLISSYFSNRISKRQLNKIKRDLKSETIYQSEAINAFLDEFGNPDELSSIFSELFSSVKAFHGCRPVDVKSYFKHGIMISDPDRLALEAKELFCSPIMDPSARFEGVLQEALDRHGPHERKAFFSIEVGSYLQTSGHYLIGGSEFLQGIAVRIDQSNFGKCTALLRTRGIPTIFECDIPTSSIPKTQKAEILKDVFGCSMLDIPPVDRYLYDLSLALECVPPEHIIDHKHPTKVPDPHNRFYDFINSRVSCSECEIRD